MDSPFTGPPPPRGREEEEANEKFEEVVSILRVISQLRPGEKISVNPFSIQKVSWTNALWRWWGREGRDCTYEFLVSLFESAFAHLRAAMDAERRGVRGARGASWIGKPEQFQEAIRGAALAGLNTLASTYGEDQLMVSRLSTLRDNVQLRLQDINQEEEEADEL